MGAASEEAAAAAADVFHTWLGVVVVRVVGAWCAAATGGAVASATAAWAARWAAPPRAAATAEPADVDAWPS